MNGETLSTGVIESASTNTHAPASSILYRIVINTPNGGVRRLENVRPIGVTYTDIYGVDVLPHPRGTPVTVSEVAGRIMVYTEREMFYAVDCDGMPIDPRPFVPIVDPDTGLPNTQPIEPSGGGGLGIGGSPIGPGGPIGGGGGDSEK